MSMHSLSQYFETVVGGAQEFIDELPDEFLHDSNKTAYQLINEINVYLRSETLTKKEYHTVTRKIEVLIEEIEKLELAYENWQGIKTKEVFADTFKSEFQHVMNKTTLKEYIYSYLSWTTIGTDVAIKILHSLHTPLLLAVLLFSLILFNQSEVSNPMMYTLVLAGALGMGITMVVQLLRLGRIPVVLSILLFGWIL